MESSRCRLQLETILNIVREVRFPNQLTESVSYFTLPDSVNESTPVDDVQLTVDRIFAFDLLDRWAIHLYLLRYVLACVETIKQATHSPQSQQHRMVTLTYIDGPSRASVSSWSVSDCGAIILCTYYFLCLIYWVFVQHQIFASNSESNRFRNVKNIPSIAGVAPFA